MSWKKNLYVLCIAQFVVMVTFQMIIPFLPYYVEHLGVTEFSQVTVWTGIIASANFLAQALMAPVWGSLADRSGCKIMVLRSLVGISIGSLLLSLTTNVYQFTAVRALMGAFSGYNAAAIALVAVNTPEDRLGYSLGLLQSSQVAGMITGPLFGGLIASFFGYQPIFYCMALGTGLAALMSFLLVQENRRPQKPGAGQEGFSAFNALSLLKERSFLYIFIVIFMVQFSVRLIEPMIPLYVRMLYGAGEFLSLLAGFVIAATGIANMAASPLLGRRSDSNGYKPVLVLALAGAGVLYLFQSLAGTYWQLVTLRFLLGFCLAGILPSVNAIASLIFPREQKGKAFGMMASATFLGNFAGPLAGGLAASRLSIQAAFIISGLIMIINSLWVARFVAEPDRSGKTKATIENSFQDAGLK